MALPDTFDKLKELLTQDQFELLLDEEKKEEKQKIRLVYLMNDAVESFLVFHEARLTGEYRKEYEGELVSSLSEKEKDEIPGRNSPMISGCFRSGNSRTKPSSKG